LIGCRREEKTKERTNNAVSSIFYTRIQLKKDNKQAETAVYPVFSGVFARV
jgi:hypothetical protein